MNISISDSNAICTVSATISSQPGDHPIAIWHRVDNSEPAVLRDSQRQAHQQTSGQLLMASEIAQQSSTEMPDATAITQTGHWWQWTTALLVAKAAEGWLETFIGRLVQEGILALSGHPDAAGKVSDSALAAHAAVNITMGTLAAARTALHSWRGVSQPQAYLDGLRGESSAPLAPAAFIAGTPQQPVSQMAKVTATTTAALATFAVASHSGWIALSHLGHSSPGKEAAYHAVVASNANTSYVWTRELVHSVLQRLGLVSHHAPLTPAGAAAASAQYLTNSLLQHTTASALGINRVGEFDPRWPILSAAAEAVDVSFIAGAARCARPQAAVSLCNGRWRENNVADGATPAADLISRQTVDRISQRAVGRQMVTEVARIMPFEIGQALRNTYGDAAEEMAGWAGAVAASATHLREPLWQAEIAASRARPNPA